METLFIMPIQYRTTKKNQYKKHLIKEPGFHLEGIKSTIISQDDLFLYQNKHKKAP